MIVPVETCNICLEEVSSITKCNKCKNSNVCNSCLKKLEINNINNRCPICRQNEWYDNSNSVNIRVIIETKSNEINPVIHRQYNIVDVYKRISCIMILSGISYCCGVVTMIIIRGKPLNKINAVEISIIALLLGMIEVNCVLFTCYKLICRENIRNCHEYVTLIMR